MKVLALIVVSLCCLGFLAVGICVAISAHHYQVLNQPMPNGKRGSMTFRDGYAIAAGLVLVSIALFLVVRRLWHSLKKPQQST